MADTKRILIIVDAVFRGQGLKEAQERLRDLEKTRALADLNAAKYNKNIEDEIKALHRLGQSSQKLVKDVERRTDAYRADNIQIDAQNIRLRKLNDAYRAGSLELADYIHQQQAVLTELKNLEAAQQRQAFLTRARTVRRERDPNLERQEELRKSLKQTADEVERADKRLLELEKQRDTVATEADAKAARRRAAKVQAEQDLADRVVEINQRLDKRLDTVRSSKAFTEITDKIAEAEADLTDKIEGEQARRETIRKRAGDKGLADIAEEIKRLKAIRDEARVQEEHAIEQAEVDRNRHLIQSLGGEQIIAAHPEFQKQLQDMQRRHDKEVIQGLRDAADERIKVLEEQHAAEIRRLRADRNASQKESKDAEKAKINELKAAGKDRIEFLKASADDLIRIEQDLAATEKRLQEARTKDIIAGIQDEERVRDRELAARKREIEREINQEKERRVALLAERQRLRDDLERELHIPTTTVPGLTGTSERDPFGARQSTLAGGQDARGRATAGQTSQVALFNVFRDRRLNKAIEDFNAQIDKATDPKVVKSLTQQRDALRAFAFEASKSSLSLEDMGKHRDEIAGLGNVLDDLELDLQNSTQRTNELNEALLRMARTRGNRGLRAPIAADLIEPLKEQLAQAEKIGDGDAVSRLRTQIRALGRDLNDADQRTNRFRDGFTLFARRIARSDVFKKLGLDTDNLKDSLQNASKEIVKTGNSLNDLTNIDETIAIGFRRIARLGAVLLALLPLLSVAFGVLLGGVTALVGGITALGAALGTLVGFLGAIPALAAGAGGALAAAFLVFRPAISQITDAVKKAEQVKKTAEQNKPQTTAALKDAEERVTDVRRTNSQQLQRLDEQERDTRLQGVEQIADAERELHHDRIQHAEDEADLRRRIADAQRENARQLQDAERRLAEVRKRNISTERDLAEDVNNARAGLSALRQAGADPSSLSVAQANVRRAERAQEKFKASEAASEEKRAEQDVQRIKADNVREIAQLRRELARKIRDDNYAEQTAETRLQRMRRDNARQLQQLEQQRHDTILSNATQERDALQAVAKAQDAITSERKDAFAGLDPQQRSIATTILSIRDAFNKATGGLKTRFLLEVEKFLRFIDDHMPGITRVVNRFGDVWIRLFDKAFATFTSSGNAARINRLLEDGFDIFQRFGDAVLLVADAFLKLGDAARPVTRLIGEAITSASQSLNNNVSGFTGTRDIPGGDPNADNPQSARFFSATERVARLVTKALKDLGQAFLEVLKVAEPFGEVLLEDFTKWTDKVLEFTQSASGQTSLKSFFEDAIPPFKEIIGLGADLVETLFLIGRDLIRPGDDGKPSFIERVATGLRDALPGFREFIVESTQKNGPGLIRFFSELTHVIGVLVGPGGAITQLISFFGEVLGFFNAIADVVPFGDQLLRFFLAFVTIGPFVTKFVASIARTRALLTGLFAGLSERGLLLNISGPLGRIIVLLTLLIGPGRIVSGIFDKIGKAMHAIDWAGNQVHIQHFSLLLVGTLLPALQLFGFRLRDPIRSMKDLITNIKLFRIFVAQDGWRKAFEAFFPRLTTVVDATAASFKRLGLAVLSFAKRAVLALRSIAVAMFTPPLGIIAAIAAIVTALVILEVKFHIFEKLYHLAIGPLSRIVGWIRDHWKLIALLVFPFIGIGVLIATHLRGIYNAISGFVGKVSDFLRTHWKTILLTLLLGPFGLIAQDVYNKAKEIGINIIRGIVDGVKSLPGAIKDALTGLLGGAVSGIKHFLRISSPSGLLYDEIGIPMGQGVVEGFKDGLTPLGKTAEDAMADAMDRAIATVNSKKGELKQSFGDLQSAVSASFSSRASALTPAGRRLAELDRQDAARTRAQTIRDANTQVQQAQQQLAKDARAGKTSTVTRMGPYGPYTVTQRTRTKEQRDAIAADKTALKQAQAARTETLRQIAEEDERARLTALDQQQQAARQKTIDAEQRRAEDGLNAFYDALDKANTPAKLARARAQLIKFLDKINFHGPERAAILTKLAQLRLSMVQQLTLTNEQRKKIIASFSFAGALVFDKPGKDGRVIGFTMGPLGGTHTVTTPSKVGGPPVKTQKPNILGPVPGRTVRPEGTPIDPDVQDALAALRLLDINNPGARKILNSIAPIGAKLRRTEELKGTPELEILAMMLDRKFITRARILRERRNVLGFAVGGVVPGAGPVPVMAHGGEWFLNAAQQRTAAAYAGVSPQTLAARLFRTSPHQGSFAAGGQVAGPNGTTVNAPITINNPAAPLDPNYLARILEARMSSVP